MFYIIITNYKKYDFSKLQIKHFAMFKKYVCMFHKKKPYNSSTSNMHV